MFQMTSETQKVMTKSNSTSSSHGIFWKEVRIIGLFVPCPSHGPYSAPQEGWGCENRYLQTIFIAGVSTEGVTSQTSGSFCSANRSVKHTFWWRTHQRARVGTSYFTLYYSPWEMLLSSAVSLQTWEPHPQRNGTSPRGCATHHLHPLPCPSLPGLCFSLKQDFYISPLSSLEATMLVSRWIWGQEEGKSDMSLSGSFV